MQKSLTSQNSTVPKSREVIGGIVGALISGIASGGSALAVSCCAGPTLFVALGLGAGGATFFEKLAPYRLIFSIISVAMLMLSFWRMYLRKQTACEGSCPTEPSKASKIIFRIAVVLVASALIIPPALDALMLK